MTKFPNWYYDEIQQVGLDFEDSRQVEAYERNQGSNAEAELNLIDRLGIAEGHSLIDLGAGTGSFALRAARGCDHVHVVDVSRAMLDYARTKSRLVNLKNVTFHHGGFLTYHHRSGPVDFIVTRFALHHLPDFWKMTGLRRMHEMLKPGGTLYLCDVVFSFEPADYRTEIAAWIDRVAASTGKGFTAADFESHVREEYSTYAWIIEGMLARAGFRIEESIYTDPAYAEYTCSKIDA